MKRIILYCCLIMMPATTIAQDMNYYLVLGSFRNARAAEIFAEEMRTNDIKPVEVSRAELDSGVYYRVVHGPFSRRDRSAHGRLTDLGIDRIWWLVQEQPDNRLAELAEDNRLAKLAEDNRLAELAEDNRLAELAKRDGILLMSNREYAIFCVRAPGGERIKYCNDEMLDERAGR